MFTKKEINVTEEQVGQRSTGMNLGCPFALTTSLLTSPPSTVPYGSSSTSNTNLNITLPEILGANAVGNDITIDRLILPCNDDFFPPVITIVGMHCSMNMQIEEVRYK